jgi:hypothetical protein
MTLIGCMRFLDAAQTERGRVEVAIEGDVVTLMMERDGVPHRLHISANAAEKIAGHLERAADRVRRL